MDEKWNILHEKTFTLLPTKVTPEHPRVTQRNSVAVFYCAALCITLTMHDATFLLKSLTPPFISKV